MVGIDELVNQSYIDEASREMQAILDLTFFQLKHYLNYNSSAAFLYTGEEFNLLNYGSGVNQQRIQQAHLALLQVEATDVMVNSKIAVRISDTLNYSPLKEILEEWPDQDFQMGIASVRSWVAIPLIQRDLIIGAVTLGSPTPEQFSEHQVISSSNMISRALDARSKLYSRLETRAIQEERLRLARELHDSITQVFYGIQLETTAAVALLHDNNPDSVHARLKEVLHLAEGGLAELRALLLQLHPDSLQSEGLRVALLKLLTIFEKRHNLEIEAKLSPEPLLSLEAKEGVYRISQEILQNVAKHAAATSVKFSLIENGPNILLEISDNGRGFDSSAHFPGHFGLSNIRERAMLLHANLKIESHPGHGTCIQVDFPLSN